MRNPTPGAASVAYWKKRCLDYLYDFSLGTNKWQGVGCTVDPRIVVTYEGWFPHKAHLASTYKDSRTGIGYLQSLSGVECGVRASDESVMWKRLFRCMKLAYEKQDSYKVYCIRKKRRIRRLNEQYTQNLNDDRNDWLHEQQDMLEDELLTYAEGL